MVCHHLEPQRIAIPPPDVSTVQFDIIKNLGEKGRAFPPMRLIEVDQYFWQKIWVRTVSQSVKCLVLRV